MNEIKAQELRLGNLVTYNSKPFIKNKVRQIDYKDFRILEVYPDKYSPTPLNDDILTNTLGWEKRKDGVFTKGNYEFVIETGLLWYMNQNLIGAKSFTFVHELQNIMIDLGI